MDNLELSERLERIEKLLSASKSVLTFTEACDYTGISRSYMYKLTSTGNIPHSKPNNKMIFFDKEKLDKWLLRNHKKSEKDIQEEALGYTLRNKR
ncbi:DNA-binding protein [Sinomicrobium pectinilyticum]|uniref:DNA-binding protein n=1 Tax=Sinomicrobium pectinilyticum TaxID=1084421 RepID=A0A3N0F4Z9_SINP1|nr:helix-turn-helix domain-containing protein [Sinomicrobium pectinilyticum]RNL95194.1 DNA-binding protein [Sinomicrobium pectinilyticum]